MLILLLLVYFKLNVREQWFAFKKKPMLFAKWGKIIGNLSPHFSTTYLKVTLVQGNIFSIAIP